jgi:peptidoglycan/LPS O-acetylase OafA/YrhL
MADCILAAATATLIWAFLSASQAAPAAFARLRYSRGLARFSYTLYLVHFPLLTLIAGLLVRKERWLPTSLHILVALGILAVTLAYAYGIAHTKVEARQLGSPTGNPRNLYPKRPQAGRSNTARDTD